MNTSRRKFVKNSALTLAAVSVLPGSLFARGDGEVLTGIQLYSIRDDMKNDPLGTLQKLAEMGYTHVEHANYVNRKFYGWEPKEFKKILGDLGIQMPSGHTVLAKNHYDPATKDFTDQWKYTVEDAATVGQDFVISPWLAESIWKDYDQLLSFMEVFNKSGELCKQSGMKFGYHNHAFEFDNKVNDMVLYDIILKNTDPDVVIQQLDVGNLYNGGTTARDVMKQHPGRFPSMHVKDEIESEGGREKYESTILGKGIVGVKEVIDFGKKSGGTTQFIIEQESYQGKTPLECVKEDLEAMRKWGY